MGPGSFYGHDHPALVELQAQHWDPLLHWARVTFHADIKTFTSIFSNPQPTETKEIFLEFLSSLDHWGLAGTEYHA